MGVSHAGHLVSPMVLEASCPWFTLGTCLNRTQEPFFCYSGPCERLHRSSRRDLRLIPLQQPLCPLPQASLHGIMHQRISSALAARNSAMGNRLLLVTGRCAAMHLHWNAARCGEPAAAHHAAAHTCSVMADACLEELDTV